MLKNTVKNCNLQHLFIILQLPWQILLSQDLHKEHVRWVLRHFPEYLAKDQNYLLQKSTELGINKLIPLNTKRTIIKIDKKSEPSKNIRWKKICKEASEQSFRTDLPVLEEILSLKDLAFKEYDLKLLCSLNKNTKNIKKVLQKNNKCVKILIVVGPEGGFDPKEEEYLVNNGFISVSLGNTVLRAETAPVVAISMINYEFMRWVVWKNYLQLRLILLIAFIII